MDCLPPDRIACTLAVIIARVLPSTLLTELSGSFLRILIGVLCVFGAGTDHHFAGMLKNVLFLSQPLNRSQVQRMAQGWFVEDVLETRRATSDAFDELLYDAVRTGLPPAPSIALARAKGASTEIKIEPINAKEADSDDEAEDAVVTGNSVLSQLEEEDPVEFAFSTREGTVTTLCTALCRLFAFYWSIVAVVWLCLTL